MDQNSTSSVASPVAPVQVTNKRRGPSGGCIVVIVIVLLVFFVISICGMLTVLLMAGGSSSQTSSGSYSSTETVIREGGEKKAAKIYISGVITGAGIEESLFSSAQVASPTRITADIDRALTDDDVEIIILNIESPGGEVVASDIIYNKVIEARKSKPVIAYSTTTMASGGYYIAAGADEIITHPGVITGSIGVIMQTSDISGLYEKLGIETVTFKSGALKDNSNLTEEGKDGELGQVYQTLVDDYYDDFVKAIVEGRGMDEAIIRELGDGRVYSGKQAEANGLVDILGYEDDLYDRAEEITDESNLTIVEYSSNDFWGSLFGSKLNIDFLPGASVNEPDYSMSAYYLISL